MNLNEECLLQFLKNNIPATGMPDNNSTQAAGGLTADLRRILRRKQYVSFPQAILIRRPYDE